MNKLIKLIFFLFICTNLYAQNAYLSINCGESGATVKLNGIIKGSTPFDKLLNPGTYTVTIEKPYSVDEEYYYNQKITLTSNEIKKMNISLPRRYTQAYKTKKVQEEKQKAEEARQDAEIEKNTSYGSFIDKRDGKTYRTTQINNQTWFVDNLAFQTPFGYEKNKISTPSSGGVYTFNAAKQSCPNGWHLPSLYEFRAALVSLMTGEAQQKFKQDLSITRSYGDDMVYNDRINQGKVLEDAHIGREFDESYVLSQIKPKFKPVSDFTYWTKTSLNFSTENTILSMTFSFYSVSYSSVTILDSDWDDIKDYHSVRCVKD